ncbi:MAG TPA: class I SAM-dependent methyltransferase [Acidimicrobiales bacterium]|jgi:predicted O-methyltransferase YrrM|nr:class I SAM-dependent methyltransferase [Acidimicrobiales bacterium]
MRPEPSFADALAAVAHVDGWMTDGQARLLWDRALATASGERIVEIGSFRGRSTTVLALAAPVGVDIVAIDPHAGNDRGPQEIEGFEDAAAEDHEMFHANLDRAGVAGRVRHVRAFSQDALGAVSGEIALLYIDGAHRYRPALADIRVWGGRVRRGGTLLIHDSFSSVGVTLAILRALTFGFRFRYVGRVGSMTEYRCELVARGARRRNVARQLRELPWFARNVTIKVLLVARLGALTRLLGHRSRDWPY